MDIEDLMKIGETHQVRIDSHDSHVESTPFYFDSLRHGFGYYFNTFMTKNHLYDRYSLGLSDSNNSPNVVSTFPRDMLDEDNTILSIVSLQRFFELLIKNFLRQENPSLLVKNGRSIGFKDALDSFYNLQSSSMTKIGNQYLTLRTPESKGALQYLTWWRNRILHSGNCLPSLWLLDYIFTQLLIPIIIDIISNQQKILGDSLFYIKTVTGINILEELGKIKFTFESLSDGNKRKDTFRNLLLIGQLKELGRSNLNMNLFVRRNQASYEYNYRDVRGRGMRFAKAEANHEHFSAIVRCPCCDVESLVLYKESVIDIFSKQHELIHIEWVKCYTCDYHLRYNVGDISHFGFPIQTLFHLK